MVLDARAKAREAYVVKGEPPGAQVVKFQWWTHKKAETQCASNAAEGRTGPFHCIEVGNIHRNAGTKPGVA